MNMQRRKSKWAQRFDTARVDKSGWQTLNKKLDKLFDEDKLEKLKAARESGVNPTEYLKV